MNCPVAPSSKTSILKLRLSVEAVKKPSRKLSIGHEGAYLNHALSVATATEGLPPSSMIFIDAGGTPTRTNA
jgi:hypothetical protein